MTLRELTDDAFLGGKLHILQPAKGFRSGLDAVLLAAAVPAVTEHRGRVLDAGAGVGVVGLAIAARCPGATVTLVEIDAETAALAQRNADRNAMADRVKVVIADVSAGGRLLHDPSRPDGLAPAAFDHLVTNPPYFAVGAGTPPASRGRAGAHQMAEGSLDRWIAFLATAAAADATLTMIHRADALADVLKALDGRFGHVRIVPVRSHDEAIAGRIVVAATKGSRAPLEIRPDLIIHGADGRVLPPVEAILRHGAAFAI